MSANERKITKAIKNACAEICDSMPGTNIDPNLVLIAAVTLGNPPVVGH
jgi:hypothetical protein